ncbi:bifunctional DNA-formamidopyrimidine glycosylase/DNA-(apurinic or apyrimidinic site) lyase [Marinobacter sp. CHS3-4]|uniref:bifunctional DNA-formamidopyrimidine glycosylase/DNA-(apurinic or apyrimidinic site) lyase n=1 Tax=Marinobacter sp. CHS3-4 TaxID=3045174 RepID=UPI0024B62956|nr:bifunctional DNA-formamidopyrimidine glycosylase/DNA-(apurinic or apyrimidinic site) lyase [Marinobacter sp. CHS3-4]MDI9243964.1 bifunctional DNA-formamidopyrimidine glycosylase/DNA-(apurinic or apyrimidinic site) lyase [Marinobacter sp. CHS3-4]
MPELPEVETTRRGIAPHCENQVIASVVVRDSRLRWPVPDNLADLIEGTTITEVDRRAKYLLIRLHAASDSPTPKMQDGTLIVHLGMSGSLRVVTDASEPLRHDHIDLQLHNGVTLRFNDPRRFGCWLWTDSPDSHQLLTSLGPEPLAPEFNGAFLHRRSRGKKTPIKSFIMDNHVVVGVGNIYANEALFKAGIHPKRAAGRISLDRYHRLAEAICETLSAAILMGGTTLRDFINSDGKPGYFAQSLLVYGRGNEPCRECGHTLKEIRMNQRATVYCGRCQR